MLIQPINFTYSKSLNFGFKNPFLKPKKEEHTYRKQIREFDSVSEQARYLFVKQMQRQNEEFIEFALKNKKLTREEYFEIRENQPYLIARSNAICQKEGGSHTSCSPKDIADAARALCDHYDVLYGEDGYKILSVGTSPALIAEAMQLWKPELNVMFAPISRLKANAEDEKITEQYPNIATLMKYCTQKGIAKDKDKKIIVLDFTNTGSSLLILKRILTEREDIEEDQIKIHSIIGDLLACEKSEYNCWINKNEIYNINSDMRTSKIMETSNVPHFFMDEYNYKDGLWTVYKEDKSDEEVFEEFDNYSTPTARAWILSVAHELFKDRQNV